MGEVYRARDTRLGRDVAVKVLPEGLAGSTEALARFASEARAVAALSHPNILALFDVGEADGVHYAVSELLEGETLRMAMAHGPMAPRRALDIAYRPRARRREHRSPSRDFARHPDEPARGPFGGWRKGVEVAHAGIPGQLPAGRWGRRRDARVHVEPGRQQRHLGAEPAIERRAPADE
jgi:protein kinase-like protein